MSKVQRIALCTLLVGAALPVLLGGCATGRSSESGVAPTPSAAASIPELPAPKKTILVFEGDTSQAYEVLGDIEASLTDQRIYNYDGSRDQVREHLKRSAYAKYGDGLDAIINYRTTTVVGGGGFWGVVGASYGARNTDIKASGVAVRFKSSGSASATLPPDRPMSPAVAQSSPTGGAKEDVHAPKVADLQPAPSRSTKLSGSELIRAVQAELNAARLLAAQPTGTLGPQTRAAIMRYQRENGLGADGLVSQELLDRLRRRSGS